MTPTCWIIADPNGAGKTAFALEYLPQVAGCRHFINANLIAAGLAPLAPERELLAASRMFLREIEVRIREREDFAFETTLAGRTYLRLVERLRRGGWCVELIFPRYHQLQAVRQMVAAASEGVGHNDLGEHSAGSGKSNTIAWLAHRLSSLHNERDEWLFDSVVVITDRVVLDRQLQDSIYQFDHPQGGGRRSTGTRTSSPRRWKRACRSSSPPCRGFPSSLGSG